MNWGRTTTIPQPHLTAPDRQYFTMAATNVQSVFGVNKSNAEQNKKQCSQNWKGKHLED